MPFVQCVGQEFHKRGDFRTVREPLFLRKKSDVDNARRIAALEAEVKAKKETRAPMGFA